jgi:hypothetical protein
MPVSPYPEPEDEVCASGPWPSAFSTTRQTSSACHVRRTASFVVPSALLSLLLVVTLPMLLLWAGVIVYQVGRHSLR